MNCARIYNCSLATPHARILNNKLAFASVYHTFAFPPPLWPSSLVLRDKDVLNGFFIYSLLLDKAERGSCLFLGHDILSQKHRLGPALSERNKCMEGIGQECYNHACDLCFFVIDDEHGNHCMFLILLLGTPPTSFE